MLTGYPADKRPTHSTRVDSFGIIHFDFTHIMEDSMAAWSSLHAERYSEDEGNLLIMVNIPKGEMMPYAHMTQNMKQWLSKGNPMMPTRHAYVTRSYIPALLIQSLMRTVPGVDLKVAFFDAQEEALAWLLNEQQVLNSVEHTMPQYKLG